MGGKERALRQATHPRVLDWDTLGRACKAVEPDISKILLFLELPEEVILFIFQSFLSRDAIRELRSVCKGLEYMVKCYIGNFMKTHYPNKYREVSFQRAFRLALAKIITFHCNTLVWSAQFSPDGTNIVSASADKTVRVWRVATGGCVQTYHTRGVNYAQFSPDGTNIVLMSGNNTIQIWYLN